MSVKPMPICPECKAGKHENCKGDAWDFEEDRPIMCMCRVCLSEWRPKG